jgi:hypothetical protein
MHTFILLTWRQAFIAIGQEIWKLCCTNKRRRGTQSVSQECLAKWQVSLPPVVLCLIAKANEMRSFGRWAKNSLGCRQEKDSSEGKLPGPLYGVGGGLTQHSGQRITTFSYDTFVRLPFQGAAVLKPKVKSVTLCLHFYFVPPSLVHCLLPFVIDVDDNWP